MAIEPAPDDQPRYRTQAEAARALGALTQEERVKLMIVARMFWANRGLSDRWGSPEELLNEAILRTLKEGGKRWRVGVDIMYHLKRAMENVSGHLARKRLRLAEHEVEPNDDIPQQASLLHQAVTAGAVQVKELLDQLRRHFGADEEAFDFLVRRSQGMSESESAADLGIEQSRIEGVARRYRRKVASFKKRRSL